MKLIHRLLFVFFLISPFANLHTLNASEPRPTEAAGGAGGDADWMPQELRYKTVKKILDTQNITGWNQILKGYGIKNIQDVWRASNLTEPMLDYCWKEENEATEKKYKRSRGLSALISQAMTSNEFIKDAIHTQNLAALKDAICNVFDNLFSEAMSEKAVLKAVSIKETILNRPLTSKEYGVVRQNALDAFDRRMPSQEEYEEALMRWSIEYPSILPQAYILGTYDESVPDPRKSPRMTNIFKFFNAYSESNEKIEEITNNPLEMIYESIRAAINLQSLKMLQICRKNYGEQMIIDAWKAHHHARNEPPERYAMNKGIREPLFLAELALYTPAFQTHRAARARNTLEETRRDACLLPPKDEGADTELMKTERDLHDYLEQQRLALEYQPLNKQRTSKKRPPAPPAA